MPSPENHDEDVGAKPDKRLPRPNSISHISPKRIEQEAVQSSILLPSVPEHAARAGRPNNDAVPEDVRKRFVQVGRKFYFPDGDPAFEDRGQRLTTRSENTELIRNLLAIASARDWTAIHVTGTEHFRKEAWMQARLAGLTVRGYKPNEVEQAQLVRKLAQRQGAQRETAAAAVSDAPRESRNPPPSEDQPTRAQSHPAQPRVSHSSTHGKLISGRLLDHGPAYYQHDRKQPVSYFAKIETAHGEREVWGVDLERAFTHALSRPQIGDQVGLRSVGRESVIVPIHKRDERGQILSTKEIRTHRNRWIVERSDFLSARAQAARTLRDPTIDPHRGIQRHPELAGTYLQLRAAELAAHREMPNPESQRNFVETMRSALVTRVRRGAPLEPVPIREHELSQEHEPLTRE